MKSMEASVSTQMNRSRPGTRSDAGEESAQPETVSLPAARRRLFDSLLVERDRLALSVSTAEAHDADARWVLRRLQTVEETIRNLDSRAYGRLLGGWVATDLARQHSPGEAPDWCLPCREGHGDRPAAVGA